MYTYAVSGQEGKRMKKWIYATGVLLLALSMNGCGSSSFEPSISSLYIRKDGKVTYAVVESFEKEYYSEDEFRSMTEREVDTYNSQYSEPVISVNELEVKDETLYLLLDFTDADAYSAYSGEYCMAGTVGDALDAGHSFQMVFKDADFEEHSVTEVTDKKEDHVLILKSECIVQLEGTVKYVSNNVDILSGHMVEDRKSVV